MKNCETLERVLKLSADDREKTGKVVARLFYSILRQNSFTHAEIIDVTGHILDGLIKDIKVNGKDKKSPVDIQDHNIRPSSKVVA